MSRSQANTVTSYLDSRFLVTKSTLTFHFETIHINMKYNLWNTKDKIYITYRF
jgi:hypothetical protein